MKVWAWSTKIIRAFSMRHYKKNFFKFVLANFILTLTVSLPDVFS